MLDRSFKLARGRRAWEKTGRPRTTMAKITLNEGLSKISGRMGKWVYRQQNGRTVIAAHRPAEDDPSKKQLSRRDHFRLAQFYASEVLADPLRREHYRQLGRERKCPPNALLISNYLTPPTVDLIDLADVAAAKDAVIRIVASDAIEVVSVAVTIRQGDGTTFASGEAEKEHGIWLYRLETAVPAGLLSVEVVAKNRAGTKGTGKASS
jgi:hypothetical protein